MSDIGQLLSHYLMEGRSYVLATIRKRSPVRHTMFGRVVFHKRPEQASESDILSFLKKICENRGV